MKRPADEPALKTPAFKKKRSSPKGMLRKRIMQLLRTQRFAVLSTQGNAQPYASLIGFAVSPDLQYFFFSTPKTTRKYRLLKRWKKVALQIDNRPDHARGFMKIESVTVTGRASEIKNPERRRKITRLLVKRHPYLKLFYGSPTAALIEVRVVRYFHVYRFQEVSQWIPGGRG